MTTWGCPSSRRPWRLSHGDWCSRSVCWSWQSFPPLFSLTLFNHAFLIGISNKDSSLFAPNSKLSVNFIFTLTTHSAHPGVSTVTNKCLCTSNFKLIEFKKICVWCSFGRLVKLTVGSNPFILVLPFLSDNRIISNLLQFLLSYLQILPEHKGNISWPLQSGLPTGSYEQCTKLHTL